MSTEETASPVNDISDNLDDFSKTFFQTETPKKDEPELESPDPEVVVETDATEELEPDDTEDDTEETPPPEAKKKSRFQERIDELTNKAKEAERKEQSLRAEFEAFKTKLENPVTPPVQQKEDTGPQPDDKTNDGEDKYPLGEFDPTYIRDLTRYTFKVEREAAIQEDERSRYNQTLAQQKAELQSGWEAKLAPARERYPDFQEKGEALISSFNGIEQAYGEYLTSTLMSMDHGTDVLYYLAANPDEAQKIIASGAAKATIALGRIEAKFVLVEEEKQRARPKVSTAPSPPAHLNKGSAVVEPEQPDDGDDLDAFAKKFFKKSRRQ